MDGSEAGLRSNIMELDKEIAVLQSRLQCSLDARDLQAKEYERRLEELNHAHEQQVERNADYVSREMFEAKTEALEKRLAAIERWHWISMGATGIIGTILGLFIDKVLLR